MLSALLKPRLLSLLWLILICIPQSKADNPKVTVNGIKYGINLTDNYAYVNKCASTDTGAVVIQKSIVYGDKSYPVTYIGWDAFSNCRLTSITIPSTVTHIGWNAFRWCSYLTSVTIPPSVTYIDESAFEGCSGLTSVDIPSSVTKIDNCAFSYCDSLTSVSIPSSVTEIGNRAFYRCSRLSSITIEGKTEFKSRVFDKCTLKPLLLKDTIKYTSDTFSGLNENSVIYAPESQVEEIKKYFPNTYAHD